MSQRAITAGATAGGTAALLPELQIPVVQTLGPIGKILIGGAIAWFTWQMTGTMGAVGLGLGLGLFIDGVVDLTVGPGLKNVTGASS